MSRMNRFRFSLMALVCLVAVVAVGVATLIERSMPLTFALQLPVLAGLVAVLLALRKTSSRTREPRRAPWRHPMTRFRFSLIALMAAVFIVAVGFAGLLNASRTWANGLFTLTAGALFVGLLGLVCGRREVRVYWWGFVLFGWGYSVMVFGPWFQTAIRDRLITTNLLSVFYSKVQRVVPGPPGTPRPWPLLWVTSNGNISLNGRGVKIQDLARAYRREGIPSDYEAVLIYDPGVEKTGLVGSVQKSIQSTGRKVRWRKSTVVPSQEDFDQVGHSLFTLLIALAGGVLAVWCFGERGDKQKPSET